jgi:chromosome segregation ATPase
VSTIDESTHSYCNRKQEDLKAEVRRLNGVVKANADYITELHQERSGQQQWIEDQKDQIENLTSYANARDNEIRELKARNKELGDAFVDLTVGKNNALRGLAAAEQKTKDLEETARQLKSANRILLRKCTELSRHIHEGETSLCTEDGCEFRFEITGNHIKLYPRSS